MASVIKIGFLGAGNVNFGGAEGPWDHASRLEKMSGLKFVGIADPLTKRAEEVLATRKKGPAGHMYDECKVFISLEAMVSQAAPDAVIVGTPPFVRGSLTPGKDLERQLVNSDIHVFAEKPLTSDSPEDLLKYSAALEESLAAHKDVVLSVGYMFRLGAIDNYQHYHFQPKQLGVKAYWV